MAVEAGVDHGLDEFGASFVLAEHVYGQHRLTVGGDTAIHHGPVTGQGAQQKRDYSRSGKPKGSQPL